jgi:hypothetical protein
MTKKQLAKAIRKGQKLIKEARWSYLEHDFMDNNSPCGCALGAAYAGTVGDGEKAVSDFEGSVSAKYYPVFTDWFSERLGISSRLASKIDFKHAHGNMSTAEIAEALEEGKL